MGIVTAINNEQKKYAGPVDENSFGMTLISANKKLPVESLKFNRQYQRATQPSRKENVKQSIIKCGQFLPDQSITVNQDYEVVDGQHRLLAAIDLKISHIPATIYSFSSKTQEAAFFVHINGFDQRLNSIDYWYGRYLSWCPVARFIYSLERDKNSLLRGKIVVKGAATKNSKLLTGQVLEILLRCMAVYGGVWKKEDQDKNIARFVEIGAFDMMSRVNDFVSWIEAIFGTKKENPVAYRRDSMRAIMLIHKRLSDKGIYRNKGVMAKLKTFNMGATFVTAPLVGKKYQLIDHFNKGRQKDRIPYNLEK